MILTKPDGLFCDWFSCQDSAKFILIENSGWPVLFSNFSFVRNKLIYIWIAIATSLQTGTTRFILTNKDMSWICWYPKLVK